jgi:predicted membrane-bound spermidine synthase
MITRTKNSTCFQTTGRSGAYLLLLAAFAGAGVMALEVLAGRIMAPAIGTGSMAWSALLAVALGSLAAGNLISGFLKDRIPAYDIAGWALTLTAAASIVLGALYKPAMHWAAQFNGAAGAITAALIGQLVPMLFLGVVSPAIVSTVTGQGARRWAGSVLAFGSIGGIAGALVIGLATLPALGLARSYAVVAGVLCLAVLSESIHRRRWSRLGTIAIVLIAAGCLWGARRDPAVIQSPLGQIEFHNGPDGRLLLFDGLPQSAWRGLVAPWDGLHHGYLMEAALIFGGKPHDALIIGLGAGLAPRLLEAHGVKCLSVELDKAIADVARQETGYRGEIVVADGRAYLARTDAEWDLIVMDVCTSDRLAMHLFTIEAMQLLRQRLSDRGVLAVQFIGDNGEWSASIAATVKRVFGEAILLAPAADIGPIGPRWLFAGRAGLPPAETIEAEEFSSLWRVIEPSAAGRLLTDDHFPAEIAWAGVARTWRQYYGMH